MNYYFLLCSAILIAKIFQVHDVRIRSKCINKALSCFRDLYSILLFYYISFWESDTIYYLLNISFVKYAIRV